MNLSVSVCLSSLQGVQVQANQDGKQYIFIPIEDADLFVSPKNGKVYLNLNIWANRNGQPDQYGKTHVVKQNFSMERRQAMGDQQAPIVGNGKEIVVKNQQPVNQGGYQQQYQHEPIHNKAVFQQAAPVGYSQSGFPQSPAPAGAPTNNPDPASDLPF